MTETIPEQEQTSNLLNPDFKTTLLNMPEELKEILDKELKDINQGNDVWKIWEYQYRDINFKRNRTDFTAEEYITEMKKQVTKRVLQKIWAGIIQNQWTKR